MTKKCSGCGCTKTRCDVFAKVKLQEWKRNGIPKTGVGYELRGAPKCCLDCKHTDNSVYQNIKEDE